MSKEKIVSVDGQMRGGIHPLKTFCHSSYSLPKEVQAKTNLRGTGQSGFARRKGVRMEMAVVYVIILRKITVKR